MMKGYKGNRKMGKSYVMDMSGKLKEKIREKSRKGAKFQFLTYEELIARQGEIVYVLYPGGVLDQAVVYKADDGGVTLWGTYDLKGDAIISITPKSKYGAIANAAIEIGAQPIMANEDTLRGLHFPERIIETVLVELEKSHEQISESED